jgi:hypothetical protein
MASPYADHALDADPRSLSNGLFPVTLPASEDPA